MTLYHIGPKHFVKSANKNIILYACTYKVTPEFRIKGTSQDSQVTGTTLHTTIMTWITHQVRTTMPTCSLDKNKNKNKIQTYLNVTIGFK